MEIKQSSTQKYERNSFKYFLREIIQAYDLFVCKRFVFYSIITKITFEMVHVTRKKLLKHLHVRSRHAYEAILGQRYVLGPT